MGAVCIGLIGDYNPAGKAHQGAPKALTIAATAAGVAAEWEWIHTSTLTSDPVRQLGKFNALWCVPGSPYANTEAVIRAIRMAREAQLPFLGTCGGFQHAMLDIADALWGVAAPAHAELDPKAADPVIAPLSCSLVDKRGEIYFVKGSRLAGIYGVPSAVEGYHCNYGLNPRYAGFLENGPLRVSARDADGDVRAVELDDHPFFFGTLFQPERSGLEGKLHPLIKAFVEASRPT